MKQTAKQIRSNRVMNIITVVLLLISTGTFAQTAPVNTAIDGSGNGNNGILHNFSLTGNTSNWVAGAVTGSCGTFVPPAATVTAGGPTAICQGSSVTLTAGAVPGAAYQWTNGGVNINGANAQSYVASAAGSYAVVVTVSGNCIAASAATVVTVNPLPTISVSPNVAICSGSSTNLIASGGTTYSWAPSTDLNTTVGANVTANPVTTMAYVVTGTANGCSNTASVTVTVNPVPTSIAGNIHFVHSHHYYTRRWCGRWRLVVSFFMAWLL